MKEKEDSFAKYQLCNAKPSNIFFCNTQEDVGRFFAVKLHFFVEVLQW